MAQLCPVCKMKAQTLALLQALHDELEGKRETFEMYNLPEVKIHCMGHNQAIQDQQNNLQALMDKIRV